MMTWLAPDNTIEPLAGEEALAAQAALRDTEPTTDATTVAAVPASAMLQLAFDPPVAVTLPPKEMLQVAGGATAPAFPRRDREPVAVTAVALGVTEPPRT